MRYRLALFDFDGTLADSFPCFLEAMNKVAVEMRLRRVEHADLERLRGYGPRRIMQHLGISWWKAPVVAWRLRRLMTADAHKIQPFAGVPAMLERLAGAGVGLGVVTSNLERNVRLILGPESARLIAHWECKASVFGKADRLRALLKKTGLPPREVICVGDELRDHEAARAAGIDFAAVAWGFSTRDALAAAGPTLMFDRVDEIAERIAGPPPAAAER